MLTDRLTKYRAELSIIKTTCLLLNFFPHTKRSPTKRVPAHSDQFDSSNHV